MYNRTYSGRREKRSFSKCEKPCTLYNPIMTAYAQLLEMNPSVCSFECNIPIIGTKYNSDFLVCTPDDTKAIRECVSRAHLEDIRVLRKLDISRDYWAAHGISDWKIITEKKGKEEKTEEQEPPAK